MGKGEKKELHEVNMDFTINLAKATYGIQFKKKAPRAVREIKRFAAKQMFTDDVRIDPVLNRFVWSKGVRRLPKKVRVRFCRKKDDDSQGKPKFYTLVQHIEVDSFTGLQTEIAKS